MVWVSERQCNGSNAPSDRSPVVDKEQIMPGQWHWRVCENGGVIGEGLARPERPQPETQVAEACGIRIVKLKTPTAAVPEIIKIADIKFSN